MKGSPGDLAERGKEKRRKQRGGDKAKERYKTGPSVTGKIIMRHTVFKGIVLEFGKYAYSLSGGGLDKIRLDRTGGKTATSTGSHQVPRIG